MSRVVVATLVATVVVCAACGAPDGASLEPVPVDGAPPTTAVPDSSTTVPPTTVPPTTVPPTTVPPTTVPPTTVPPTTVPPTTVADPSTTVPPPTAGHSPTPSTGVASTTIAPVVTAPSVTAPEPVGPAATDAVVESLAASLDVSGPIEHRDGEHGIGQCIGRLEPRGVCVNVPTWNIWHYWDLDAQRGGQIEPNVAVGTADAFFEVLAFRPGTVTDVRENGPAREVHYDTGAYVLVTADGVAMVIASTGLPGFFPAS